MDIHDKLQHLEQELATLDMDPARRQRLQQLVDAIERELDEEDEYSDPPGLRDTLDELVSEFDAEHPTLSGILKDLMVKLASIGV